MKKRARESDARVRKELKLKLSLLTPATDFWALIFEKVLTLMERQSDDDNNSGGGGGSGSNETTILQLVANR